MVDGIRRTTNGVVETRKGVVQTTEGQTAEGQPPDSTFAHYDATKESETDGNTLSTWTDIEGANDLSASGNPTYQTDVINGNAAVNFDGSDYYDVPFTAENQPNTVYIVAKLTDGSYSSDPALFDGEGGEQQLYYSTGADSFYIFAGSAVSGTNNIGEWRLFTAVFDGSSSVIRENGTQEGSGDAGSDDFDGLTVGSRDGGGNEIQGYIGEVVACNARDIDTEFENHLMDKWGIASTSVTLSSTSVDTQAADGSQLIDIDGSGSLDILVAGDTNGDARWYEADNNWTTHTIATGYSEMEGIDAADINGNGNIEVFILDQGGNLLDIAVQDSGDPTGSWSTTTLDSDAPNVIHTLMTDVTQDGNANNLIYTVEGSTTGEGGVRWLEYNGGGLLNAANWDIHTVFQNEGVWGISRRRADISGDGETTDIAVGARNSVRHDDPNVGLWWLEPASDPRNSWNATKISSTEMMHVDLGDLSGNGAPIDIVGASYREEGLFWWDAANNYSRNTIVDNTDVHMNALCHQWTGGAWVVLTVRRDGNTSGSEVLEFWENNGAGYQLNTSTSLYKEVERLPIGQITGDSTQEFITVTEGGAVEYWEVST
jgi:hypothetical protein